MGAWGVASLLGVWLAAATGTEARARAGSTLPAVSAPVPARRPTVERRRPPERSRRRAKERARSRPRQLSDAGRRAASQVTADGGGRVPGPTGGSTGRGFVEAPRRSA